MKQPATTPAQPHPLPSRYHWFYFVAGLIFLALAKTKNRLRGYVTPKPFSITETEKSVAYDLRIVDQWLARLQGITGSSNIEGKHILELGPGSDLGIGLYLLAKGAASYSACDVHPLVYNTPDHFYDQLLQAIRLRDPSADTDSLRQAWLDWKNGQPSKLRYVVRKDFDFCTAFGESSMDLVFSQAAFEHFDDFPAVANQLFRICKSGARIVAEIDLKTHSRWIRDHDPNNIYRYPNWLYRWFYFPGIPNRLRPRHYRAAFEQAGWNSLAITPSTIAPRTRKPPRGCTGPLPPPKTKCIGYPWLSPPRSRNRANSRPRRSPAALTCGEICLALSRASENNRRQ